MAEGSPRKPGIDLRRWFRLSSRALHLLTTGVLVGGHWFDVSPEQLRPWLYGVVATGLALVATDLAQGLGYLREVRGATQIAKIAAVGLVALLWDVRLVLLFGVVLVSGVVSHMPGRYRYWVLGRGPRPEGSSAQRGGLG